MRRAVIYTRVSTDRQENKNQLQQLREFVKRNDEWELAGGYADEESGGTGRRSDFQRLFTDAHQRRFDVVIFSALDRFSREGTRATINYLYELESSGIDFVSFTERYLDSTGIFRDAIVGILAALAKQERIRLSDRVKAGMARAKKESKHVGRRPVSPTVVQEVLNLRIDGKSFSAIARSTGLGRSTLGRIVQRGR